MNKVIVTGATSFIGSVLVHKLLESEVFVYVVVRNDTKHINRIPKHPNLIIIYSDLSEINNLLETELKIDAFFHFGWEGVGIVGRNDKSIQKKNIENSLKAIFVAKKLECKCFIEAGSQAEYGFTKGIITENTICKPIIEYGRAKLEVFSKGSVQCIDSEMKYLHLRIFSIYGENDHEWTLISEVINQLMKNKNVKISQCQQYWNYLYVDDAVDQIIDLTKFMINSKNRNIEIYNIASTDTRILKDFTNEIADIIGGVGQLLYGEIPLSPVQSIQPDISKLQRDIQWKPKISFRQGILSIINSKLNDNSEV